MSRSLIVISISALLMASTSWAEKAEADYGRPGWYLGAGVGVGVPFLDEVVKDATNQTAALGAGGSFNARGGYRVASWFAVEAMYEGVYSCRR